MANWSPSVGALYNAVGGGYFYVVSAVNDDFYCARRETHPGKDTYFSATLAELRLLVRPR